MSIFEKASRLKLRVNTIKGLITVEDLWDLPLTATTSKVNLNEIAKSLHSELKNSDEVSFVETVVSKDTVTQLTFDIVKHIIGVRLAENAAAATARDNKNRREKILEMIAKKEDENLLSSSADELRAMLATL